MKKLLVQGLAALLVVAFCVPASALENVFGGYWRTRAVGQQDYDGDGTGDQDLWRVDTRTRLYYTAVLNENLKFVNKFEFDAVWGGAGTYGDFGADEVAVELFLSRSIKFTDIAYLIEQALAQHQAIATPALEEIIAADAWAREMVLKTAGGDNLY